MISTVYPEGVYELEQTQEGRWGVELVWWRLSGALEPGFQGQRCGVSSGTSTQNPSISLKYKNWLRRQQHVQIWLKNLPLHYSPRGRGGCRR